MKKSEVESYANYEVYIHNPEGGVDTICLCDSHKMAGVIARALVRNAKEHGIKVFVTSVSDPQDFVPGGGWYDVYWRDENGEIKTGGLA